VWGAAGIHEEAVVARMVSGSAPEPGVVFLASRRLYFRPWTAVDEVLAITLWGDPKVTALIGGPFTPEQSSQRLQREMALQATAGIQYWPVFLRSGDLFVGCCGLRPWRQEDSILELGFHLLPTYWGQGLAAEAADAVIHHAFETLGARGLFAGHHPENHASERLLQRLGFRYTHHEHYEPTGRMHPSYMLWRSDWGR
jgi:[ribosomal protein S5]-alanine N-acetyltransferase